MTGGGVLAFSLLATLLISLILFRHYPITPFMPNYIRVSGAFSDIYSYHPLIYSLILIINSFVFGVGFSTLGFSISVFIENEYLAIIFPFLFAIIEGGLAVPLGIESIISYIYMIDPLFYYNSTITGLVLQHLSLISLTIVVICVKISREVDKNV